MNTKEFLFKWIYKRVKEWNEDECNCTFYATKRVIKKLITTKVRYIPKHQTLQ